METVPAPPTEPGRLRQRTTADARPSPEEPTLTENDRTPIVAPLAVAGVGILLTLGLALGGTVAPGNALKVLLVGGVVAVLVAMATTCALHRVRVASLDAELARVQGQVGDAGERAATLAESRRDLVAWVSDDLRTPMARLQATAEALEDGVIEQPAEVAAALAVMHEEIDRLGGLLTDLFELSHPTAPAGGAETTSRSMATVASASVPTPVGADLPSTPCTFDMAFRAGSAAARRSEEVARAMGVPR